MSSHTLSFSHRVGCENQKNPFDDSSYQWAEQAGCIAMRKITVDGTEVSARVLEKGCAAVGGEWRERAKSGADCQAAGSVCTAAWNRHEIFGGITGAFGKPCVTFEGRGVRVAEHDTRAPWPCQRPLTHTPAP